MLKNQLSADYEMAFEKKCRMRIRIAAVLLLLGLAAAALGFAAKNGSLPVLYLSDDYHEFMSGFGFGTGGGLVAASLITIFRNRRYLLNPELKRKKSIEENDERNRLLGLRCWAYAGYTMFLFLYAGMLASVFIGVFFLKTLMLVAAVFAVTLLIFRQVLSRNM